MRLRRTFLCLIGIACLASGVCAFAVAKADAVVAALAKDPPAPLAWSDLDIQSLAMALGVSLVFAALLCWLAMRLVFDPLRRLAQSARRMGKGEAAALPAAGPGDIGDISRALTVMAANIVETNRLTEARVRETAEHVEHVQKEKAFADRLAGNGRVAAALAAELVRPLNHLQTALARMKAEDLSAPERRGLVESCCEKVRRLQSLVRRAIDFSRKRPDRAPLIVTTPLKQALELIRPRLERAGVRVQLHIEERTGSADHLRVLADAADLVQVFYSLLVNALEAMPRGGGLTVTVSQALRWVVVEILDTGIGMTVEEVADSYEYFHSGRPYGKGDGLGLSVALHVVRRYRGALTLNSVKGEGTKATVELPAAAAHLASAHAPRAASVTSVG